jgi:NADP-dependent 3-hydroxy acid dehydrogenase YdfG
MTPTHTTLPLNGKHALVTGGGQGIGAAIARHLVEAGAQVTVLGRRLETVQALANAMPGQVHAVASDVADAAQVEAAFAAPHSQKQTQRCGTRC